MARNQSLLKDGRLMAALRFKTGTTMIFDAVQPLMRFKAVLAERMQSERFTGIVIDDFQVAGGRDGGWTALRPAGPTSCGLDWRRFRKRPRKFQTNQNLIVRRPRNPTRFAVLRRGRPCPSATLPTADGAHSPRRNKTC